MDKKNLGTIRQMFANTVFTHKVQEVACERNLKKKTIIDILTLIGVSITLILIILPICIPNTSFLTYIGIAFSSIDIVFLIFQLMFNFNATAQSHKSAALQFINLRDQYLSLITDIMNESIKTLQIISQRNLLQSEYQSICSLAPQTNSEDYYNAQKKLGTKSQEGTEQYTWSDKEIDMFLPEELRLK